MSIFTHVNPSNIRVKPFEINEIVSIEKKKKFCDRPNVTFVEKDSGKKISVELQTIVYEYIKNNCIDFITSVGRANSIGNPIEGKDLRDAKIEIQYFFSVQTNSGSHTPLPLIFTTQTALC